MKEVARYLGNTPAVCRDSYIDPRIFEAFYDGRTVRIDLEAIGDAPEGEQLPAAERGVLELLTA